MLTYITSNRGNKKLLHENNLFVKDRASETTIYWKCDVFQKFKCRARVHTCDEKIIKEVGNHNHSGNQAKIMAEQKINELKDMSTSTTNSPSQIISSISNNLIQPVAAELPNVAQLKKIINRKRKLEHIDKIPQNTEELELDEQYKNTNANENFIIYDSGAGVKRIIMFGTKKNLERLALTEHWFCDGTFDSCPSIFKQILTIHGIFGGYVIPLVFCLLPDKKQKTYEKLLEILCEKNSLNPTTIMTDYETALINAFTKQFPNTEMRGCFFHFSQCIYRKIQTSGLKRKYESDADLALKLKLLSALAYIPTKYVVTAFEQMIRSVEFPLETQPVVDYFEDTWIGRPVGEKRRDPLFKHSHWNCFDAVIRNLPRTNNAIEGWHRGFSSNTESHPNIFKFIELLKKEQSKNELILNQVCYR